MSQMHLFLLSFFIPNYTKLSGLEQTTTISLFPPILNSEFGQHTAGCCLDSGWHLPGLQHPSTRPLHSQAWVPARMALAADQECLQSQVQNVRGLQFLDRKLLHRPAVVPTFPRFQLLMVNHGPKTFNGKLQKEQFIRFKLCAFLSLSRPLIT